jgi:hypothetical protein
VARLAVFARSDLEHSSNGKAVSDCPPPNVVVQARSGVFVGQPELHDHAARLDQRLFGSDRSQRVQISKRWLKDRERSELDQDRWRTLVWNICAHFVIKGPFGRRCCGWRQWAAGPADSADDEPYGVTYEYRAEGSIRFTLSGRFA